MDNFFQALGMFEKATQEYAVKSGIDDATKIVQGITSQTEMDLNQKYAMQKQVGNQLQSHLAGLGAPQSQIAAAVGAVAPPDITTVEGARQLAAQAQTPQERMEALKLEKANADAVGRNNLAAKQPLMQEEQDFRSKEQQKDRDLQWQIANLKANGQKDGKPIPASELAKLNSADATLTSLASVKQQLATMKDEIGPVSGIDLIKSWRKPEFGAFKMQVGQLFDSYRIAVTGAGASTGELEKLRQNTPTVKDPPDLFESKMLRWENTVKQIENSRLKRLKQIGYHTGELAPYEVSEESGSFKPFYYQTESGRSLHVATPEAKKEIEDWAKASGAKLKAK